MVCSAATELESRVREPSLNSMSRLLILTALLRAMAEKLIPGIPHATRIAILQQTDEQEESYGAVLNQDKTVLESVLSSDESRNEAVRMADCEYITSSNLDVADCS